MFWSQSWDSRENSVRTSCGYVGWCSYLFWLAVQISWGNNHLLHRDTKKTFHSDTTFSCHCISLSLVSFLSLGNFTSPHFFFILVSFLPSFLPPSSYWSEIFVWITYWTSIFIHFVLELRTKGLWLSSIPVCILSQSREKLLFFFYCTWGEADKLMLKWETVYKQED